MKEIKLPEIYINLNIKNLELLKYIAFVCMILDHINTFLYQGKIPYFYEIGRLAMPLFCFTFAYGLGCRRKHEIKTSTKKSEMNLVLKTLLNGVLSFYFFYCLNKPNIYWYPLNIMFLFSTVAFLIHYIENKPFDLNRFFLCSIIFFICGAVVDYFWIGLLFCLAVYYYAKTNHIYTLGLLIVSFLLLCWLNNNLFALLALILIWINSLKKIQIPRIKNLFYFLYPTHLAVLCFFKGL
jgi:TraX protein